MNENTINTRLYALRAMRDDLVANIQASLDRGRGEMEAVGRYTDRIADLSYKLQGIEYLIKDGTYARDVYERDVA
jgi:hypothetical protein